MHVLLPAWRLLSPRTGVGKTLHHYLAQLAALAPDDEFTVLHDGTADDPVVAPNVHYEPLRAPLHENVYTFNEWAVPLAARRRRADVFHNVNYTLPWFLHRHSVVTVHDLSYVRHPEWFSRRVGAYLRYGTRRAALHATLLTTVSAFSAREIVEVYGIDPARVVPILSAADEHFQPIEDLAAVRARYHLPPRYVFYLGGIHTRRRVDQLVAACARVLPRHDAHLVIAGPAAGGGYDVRRHAAEVGLADRVQVLGFVPEAHLPALYSAAAAFAWPSLYEGFGLPPLEALACGTPTVVADAASLPEVVGDAALKAAPDDAEALAEALERLLGDETLAADLRVRGPRRAAEFSWRRAAGELLDVYRRVAHS
jgi:glycosyltransferase involved in cell wall biosynthesis